MPLCQCLIPGWICFSSIAFQRNSFTIIVLFHFRLVWPKKPYDYMYAEGERLLRDFPVQATLEFASESDTDTDSDSDSDSDVVDFDHMQSNDHENSMELQARA